MLVVEGKEFGDVAGVGSVVLIDEQPADGLDRQLVVGQFDLSSSSSWDGGFRLSHSTCRCSGSSEIINGDL